MTLAARADTVVHGDEAVQPLPVAPAAGVVVRVLVRRHWARQAVHHHRRAPHREAGVQDRRLFHRTRKTTACGVALGEDVLSLVAEPHADPSLVMGLVLVHGLMNHTM